MINTLEALENSIRNKMLGHAILIECRNSNLLKEQAHHLASMILETKNLHRHPDFFTLRPSGRSRFIRIGNKIDSKKGKWPENTMRGLINDIRKTANQGGSKVAIIYEAERMNKESANAFLKTLEEPPKNSIFFLLTQRSYDLIDTIKSRCLNYKISSKPLKWKNEEWENWKEKYWNWLGELISEYKKSKLNEIFFGFYGMTIKLQKIIEIYREEIWEEEYLDLNRSLNDDEKIAIEIGIERSVRDQLFEEISELTSLYVKKFAIQNQNKFMINALSSSLDALSKSFNLLKLNFNSASAMELFFLKSLRIWSQANKN